MTSHNNSILISNDSELAHAVPFEERMLIPDNEPAPLDHEQGHIQISISEVDSDLLEVPQNPYQQGSGEEKGAGLRIPYFPSGFTVSRVLCRDLSEVLDANGAVSTCNGDPPEKTVLYLEFCHPAYSGKFRMKQRRWRATRGEFATLAAEEIQKILHNLPNFPFKLDQIKVLSIDVRSRGTVQPRLFITTEVWEAALEQPGSSA